MISHQSNLVNFYTARKRLSLSGSLPIGSKHVLVAAVQDSMYMRICVVPVTKILSDLLSNFWDLPFLLTTICNKAYVEKSGKLPIFNLPALKYPKKQDEIDN